MNLKLKFDILLKKGGKFGDLNWNSMDGILKTEYFEFEFEYQDKKIPATCYVYSKEGETELPYKYPIYRVALKTHRINPDVFLFYKNNGSFFWYPFKENKEAIGKNIADYLTRCRK